MPPNQEPESPEEFEYSGWLSFYPFRTDVKTDSIESSSRINREQTLSDKLPEYQQGRPDDPGDGFRISNTPELLDEMGLLNEYPYLEDLIHINYCREEYQQTLAYDETADDFIETSTVDISNSDLFWTYPKYLFTRGSKQKSEYLISRLKPILVNFLRTEKVEFDRDFIVWLIYKEYSGEGISEGMGVQQLQSVELTGGDDFFGRQNQISGLNGSSAVALLPLLEGKTPESIEIMFNFCGNNIISNITKDRVRVYSSKGSLVDLPDLGVMALAISFASNFMDIYDQWRKLPNEERYPPISFFKNIYREAVDEGYETKGISQSLLEDYRKLREER